jgi:cell division ATPase FtsA
MFAKAQTKVPECQVSRVVLTGGGALLKGLPEYLESSLNLPVEVFDPMDSVDLSQLSAEAQTALKQDQGGMAVALGLAQMAAEDGGLRVAVLPEEEKKKRRFKERTVFSIAAAAVLLVGLVAAWSARSKAHAEAEEEKALLARKSAEFDKNASEFERAKSLVEKITGQKEELRTLVALGPAFQTITDAVQSVINQGEEGYPEVFAVKTSARMTERTWQDAQGVTHSEKTPSVDMEARIEEFSGRQIQQVEAQFKLALRAKLNAIGGLEYTDVGSLDMQNRTFKFRVRQTGKQEPK